MKEPIIKRYVDIRDFYGPFDEKARIQELKRLKEEYQKKGICIDVQKVIDERLHVTVGYEIEVRKARRRNPNQSWSLGAQRKRNREQEMAQKQVDKTIGLEERE